MKAQTLRAFKHNDDGSIKSETVIPCGRFTKTQTPHGVEVTIHPGQEESDYLLIAPPAKNLEDRRTFKYQELYVENMDGKTIDHIGPFVDVPSTTTTSKGKA